MKYKCLGLILLIIGIIEMLLIPEDATAGFFLILLAICLLFSKEGSFDSV